MEIIDRFIYNINSINSGKLNLNMYFSVEMISGSIQNDISILL